MYQISRFCTYYVQIAFDASTFDPSRLGLVFLRMCFFRLSILPNVDLHSDCGHCNKEIFIQLDYEINQSINISIINS